MSRSRKQNLALLRSIPLSYRDLSGRLEAVDEAYARRLTTIEREFGRDVDRLFDKVAETIRRGSFSARQKLLLDRFVAILAKDAIARQRALEVAWKRHPEIKRPAHRPANPPPCILGVEPPGKGGRPQKYTESIQAWFVGQIDRRRSDYRGQLNASRSGEYDPRFNRDQLPITVAVRNAYIEHWTETFIRKGHTAAEAASLAHAKAGTPKGRRDLENHRKLYYEKPRLPAVHRRPSR